MTIRDKTMSDFHQQAIEDVAEGINATSYDVVNGLVHDEDFTQGDLAARYAVDQRERVLELEAAIKDAAEHLPREYAATVLASVLLFAPEKAQP